MDVKEFEMIKNGTDLTQAVKMNELPSPAGLASQVPFKCILFTDSRIITLSLTANKEAVAYDLLLKAHVIHKRICLVLIHITSLSPSTDTVRSLKVTDAYMYCHHLHKKDVTSIPKTCEQSFKQSNILLQS